MKAEERHELRENDLAQWLQYGMWTFLKQNGSYLLLIVALGFLGFQLWRVYQQRQDSARAVAFANLAEAEAQAGPQPTAEKWVQAARTLVELADGSEIKLVKARACVTLGQLYDFWAAFPEVQNFAKLSRAECLSKSFDYYSKARELQGDDPLIAAKASLGMAAVFEDQGEWDKAKAEYQRMVGDQMYAGDLAKLAKARLDSLDARRNAPRLVAMIPPPEVKPATTPAFPRYAPPGGVGEGFKLPTTSSGLGPLTLPPGGVGSSDGATTTPGTVAPYGPMPSGPTTPFSLPPVQVTSPTTSTNTPTTAP
jgi:predicted negative regulator of RcsB-dependent stress response